jgi:uncharacterized protein (DUF2141 family)
MRTSVFWLLSLSACSQFSRGPSAVRLDGNSNLKITVEGLHPLIGTLRIWICNEEACYASRGSEEHPYLNELRADLPQSKPVFREEDTVEFKGLPGGDYSAFIHHDKDNDGAVGTKTCTIWRKPVDGIGYSNNRDPRVEWHEPRWKDVRFKIPEGAELEEKIKMLYLCD